MLTTIGQHVCKNTGNGNLIEKGGMPVAKSIYNPQAPKNPFLGSGYYFWDYNIEMARYWGKTHYKDKYYIFEAEINCREDVLLDLVGNRKHMEYFLRLMETFKTRNGNSARWEIGKFIEFLKEISETEALYKDIFPFKSVRVIDHNATIPEVEYNFSSNSNHFINMNPRIIICIIEVSSITLQNFKLIETK